MIILLLLFSVFIFTMHLVVEGAIWAYSFFVKRLDLGDYKRRGNGSARPWALVTGASDGIGLAFVRKLAENGFSVILHGRNAEKLQGCVEQLRRRHPHVDFDTVVAGASDCSQENITRVSQACEGRDLSILVNNVGVLQNQKKMDLSDLAYEDVVSTITVNCAFNALVTRALLKQLLTNARGHRCAVINISSVLAFAAFPGFSIYTATKSFMHSLSESMAAELAGTNVDVLCVSPGYTASNMTMEKPSLLVSSADSVAEESLRRIRFVQVVPGILPMLMFLTIGSINFLPSLLRPRVVKFISSCMVYTAKGLKTQ